MRLDPILDARLQALEDFAMVYETAVVPFCAGDYLPAFYDFYRIKKRHSKLVPAAEGFCEALTEVSGDGRGQLIAAKTESLFGPPKRVMCFEDSAPVVRQLEGTGGRGLGPFFFIFDLLFCEYDGFTLCFISGSNN